MFLDRHDAGVRLAEEVSRRVPAGDAVVLGLPRGGVPVAFEVAQVLGAPLDVIVVRKLGVPYQPELGFGAVGEGGVRVVNPDVVALARLTPDEMAAVEERETAEVELRARRFRGPRPPVDLAGRTVIVVDDGIATGGTARAACQVARARGAARVVLAVPVAAPDIVESLREDADEVICLDMPEQLYAIGFWYHDFSQTTDGQVVELLRRAASRWERDTTRADPPGIDEDVDVDAAPVRLPGRLVVPEGAAGVVVFVHGSGSSRHSPRNRYVAAALNHAGLGTLLFDLLTAEEEIDRGNVFDIGLLARRLVQVTGWLARQPGVAGLPIGYFGASTGAAAALWAAAESAAAPGAPHRAAPGTEPSAAPSVAPSAVPFAAPFAAPFALPGGGIAAVVSRGGRPDLAAPRLGEVRAPTLLIVGGRDDIVLDLNRAARERLRCENALEIVPGATHLFEEPGALETVAALACDWFADHFAPQAA
ncbi:phosphoribosyltransferase [Microbispora sp. RL4-1S]|uniref:Phosphoribosyltransferase n=1 Tax=Microbispora oryzae TaxID=2806554 RepID=A0A940WG85_9ACTN|nr:phosphoribosyltransferase family protein [Microbispora oryzae]MBP2705079.1 phosphoribosyltransferase [Microbispora oryzae]